MTTLRIRDREILIQRAKGEPIRVPLTESAHRLAPEQLPELLPKEIVEQLGSQPEITLLIPASWCYLFVLEVADRRPSSEALGYALEAFVPLEIEQLTCDFQRLAPTRWLGAALETDWMQPRLAAWRASGLDITRIGVTLPSPAPGDSTDHWTVEIDAEHTTAVQYCSGQLAGVRVLRCRELDSHPAEFTRLANWLQSLTGEQPLGLSAARSDWVEALAAQLPGAERSDASEGSAVLDLARGALQSPQRARRGRAALTRLGVAACVALLLLSVGNVWRDNRAAAELRRIAAWERELLAEVLPGQAAGGAPGMRLAAELRRAKAISAPTQSGGLPSRTALEWLEQVVTALPSNARIDLQELRIESGDMTLRGRTTDHPAAERIGTAVDGIEGLTCDAPRTDRQSDGFVQFFLHARSDTPRKEQP